MRKTLNKLRIKGNYLNVIKALHEKLISNIISMVKTQKPFLYDQDRIKDAHFFHFYLP